MKQNNNNNNKTHFKTTFHLSPSLYLFSILHTVLFLSPPHFLLGSCFCFVFQSVNLFTTLLKCLDMVASSKEKLNNKNVISK